MYSLTLEQEAALAFVQSQKLPSSFTEISENFPLDKSFLLQLREIGLLEIIDSFLGPVRVNNLTDLGYLYYNQGRKLRQQITQLSNSADELALIYYAGNQTKVPHKCQWPISDYRELSQNGLLKIDWADNIPYIINPTCNGTYYVHAGLKKHEEDNVMNTTINNNYYGSTNVITASNTSGQISVGDNNKINFTYESINQAVSEIEESVNNDPDISDDNKESARQKISEINKQISKKTKPDKVKSMLSGLKKFLLEVGSNVAAGFIQSKIQELFPGV